MGPEGRNRTARPELPWPVEMLPPRRLRPAQRNARTHSKKQIRQIADSIERFGVISPIVADDRGRIVAGHARAEAAKLIGLKHVPVIRLSHLNETEIRAYVLADNKLAEKAGWDREIRRSSLRNCRSLCLKSVSIWRSRVLIRERSTPSKETSARTISIRSTRSPIWKM